MFKSWPILSFLLLAPVAGNAACFEDAAARYRVPASLLQAISRVESSGNPSAIHRNADGSHDIGHMQINSRWLPVLQQHGVSEQTLLDPCTNTYVGAWILARNISRLGYGWLAVGAYNAGSHTKRMAYAKKIAAVLRRESGT
ncbi:MAG: lytic transglycosylase domain-containing protein [Rhodocyclaceae bacterium]|nr:lytic transglycosylase domain-containing protein [Rhodocyclaceae bacterium]